MFGEATGGSVDLDVMCISQAAGNEVHGTFWKV